jgi:hypothetical protein
MSLSERDREEISNTIRTVVNGNIKRVEGKLDAHIDNTNKLIELYSVMAENLGPVADGVKWLNTSKKFIVWCGTIAAAIGATLAVFK